jgi:steroid 5-alpha reductase family enzyme
VTHLVVLSAHGAVVMLALMGSLWLLHLAMRNAAIVDVGWATGLGILAVLYASIAHGDPVRRALIGALAGVWAFRLALHLVDRVRREPEDGRYQELRARWGGNLTLKFLFFFLGQGLLDVVLAIPFAAASANEASGIGPWEITGLVIGVVSIIGESVADWQLRAFKHDPANRGTVCAVGLWRWSRHPNYFFEWLIWIAFATFATGSPFGWLSWICPAMMLYFLLRVTGIPATEAHAVISRGDAYREYQRTTSAFVPLPPRG